MDPIREEDLHAYVDGALSEARRLEVEAWLASHPEDMRKTQDWLGMNQSLHTAFDNILNEPIPMDLIRSTKRKTRRMVYQVAAALTFAVTGLTGYWLGQISVVNERSVTLLAKDAAIAHAVYSPEIRHPVEVGAEEEAHLVTWLSKRLGKPLHVPNFTSLDFELVGGRLLPGGTGPVAQFMYQDKLERRVTLYVRRDAANNTETAFRRAVEGDVEVFYWIDKGFGYAISGQINSSEMKKLADLAYRQMVIE